MDDQILLPPGAARKFNVAGVRVRFRCEPSFDATLTLSGSYQDFESSDQAVDLDIRVTSRPELDILDDPPCYDSGHHWRVHRGQDGVLFEFFHPPTGRVYCHVLSSSDFSEAELAFSANAWSEIANNTETSELVRELPHPVDQLLLVPRLALAETCVFHAAGVAIDGKAHVFAGHSGDGKTTLSRLLQREGLELLSDERIAVRFSGEDIVAHGTPWPGEGNILSRASYPLSGLYLVRKSNQHRIAEREVNDILAELLSRAIVPYYLPDVAARILSLFSRMADQVRLRELFFARRPGLRGLFENDVVLPSPAIC